MSITKRLRYFVDSLVRNETTRDILHNVADRIDQEHKSAVMGAMNDALYYANDENMAELGWVRLPKDAEGVPFHVGDHVEVPDGLPSEGKPWQAGTITRLVLGAMCWHVRVIAGGMGHEYLPENMRHRDVPTVENVLRDFGVDIAHALDADPDATVPEGIIAEYAAKLRLAGEVE